MEPNRNENKDESLEQEDGVDHPIGPLWPFEVDLAIEIAPLSLGLRLHQIFTIISVQVERHLSEIDYQTNDDTPEDDLGPLWAILLVLCAIYFNQPENVQEFQNFQILN